MGYMGGDIEWTFERSRKRDRFDLSRVCAKCGKPQPRNEAMSNDNWAVYDTSARCECGGEFVLTLNGESIEGGPRPGMAVEVVADA